MTGRSALAWAATIATIGAGVCFLWAAPKCRDGSRAQGIVQSIGTMSAVLAGTCLTVLFDGAPQ